MAPSLIMDTSDDFVLPSKTAPPQVARRTLLLSPPSLSSHQEKLTNVLQMHDRSQTDLQMLDRLAMGLVSLPESTYEIVMILSDADGSRRESSSLITRDMMSLLVKSMKPTGVLHSQDQSYGQSEGAEKNEAILAGLTYEPGRGFVKPDYTSQETVPLRFGKKKAAAQAAGGIANGGNGSVSLPLATKRKSEDVTNALPAGVGFDDGNDSDDELIDEDELMADEDLSRPITVPKECAPKAKRRRACKDCTCGLAARLEAEDKEKRDQADRNLNTLKLQSDDLAEVDFTVEGKVGSCGNCSLGGKSRPSRRDIYAK
jgi:anamorsin